MLNLPPSSMSTEEDRLNATPARPTRASLVSGSLGVGLLLLALCLVAFAAAVHVATNVIDRIPHFEDEYAFLFQAQTLASGRLLAPLPPNPEFFWIPFTVQRDGFWFGKYPLGYPLVLAAGVIAGQPWLVNPLLAVACVLLLYALGSRLYDRPTALVSAALLVASPLFILQSASFLSHVAALAWTTLFILTFVLARRGGRFPSAIVAGMALGMLFLTRPFTAVAIAAPFAVWGVVDLARRPGRLARYAVMALAFAPFLLSFLAYNTLTTGNPLQTAYESYWPYDKVGFGPGYGLGEGHTLEMARLNARAMVDMAEAYVFGWPLGLAFWPAAIAAGFAAFSAVRLGYARLRRLGVEPRDAGSLGFDLLLASVVVSLVLAHFAYWAPGTAYGPRYYFEALGAFVLLSARGLVQLARALAKTLVALGFTQPRALLAGALATLLPTLALFTHAYTNWVPQEFGRFVRWYDIDASGVKVVRAANLKHAVVLVQFDYWTDYAPFFPENNLTFDGEVVYAIDRGEDNAALYERYSGRSFYRYADGRLTPAPPPAG